MIAGKFVKDSVEVEPAFELQLSQILCTIVINSLVQSYYYYGENRAWIEFKELQINVITLGKSK